MGLPKPKPKARLSADGNVNDAAVNKFNLPLSPESDDAILHEKSKFFKITIKRIV